MNQSEGLGLASPVTDVTEYVECLLEAGGGVRRTGIAPPTFGSVVVERGGGICAERAESEPPEQQHQRRYQAAYAVDDEGGRPAMCPTSQLKFWPKKPVMKVSGRKTVAKIPATGCTGH